MLDEAGGLVMIHEDRENPLEMLLVQDQQPVETLGTNGPHKRAATPFACGARNGVRRISQSALRNTSSKLSVNF